MAYSECNWQQIKLTVAETGRATLTLARPEVGNAFNEVMIAELTEAFAFIDADSTIRVVVMAAEGKHFCTGADLSWMRRASAFDLAENQADAAKLALMLDAWDNLCKPTICLVHGACYGGGVGLVAAADMVVATADAKFCLSEVKLGLIPAVISPYVLRAIGARHARRIMQTAEVISADYALTLGLVHAFSDNNEQAERQIASWSQSLIANSQPALAAVKKLVAEVNGQEITAELRDKLAELIAEIRVSDSAKQRIQTFLERK